jgi:hypothetical protein
MLWRELDWPDPGCEQVASCIEHGTEPQIPQNTGPFVID